MNLIKLEGICKSFGEKNLFNNLSMEIEQGEFVSIMGESGAGKTTLLNIIGMLEPPDRGNVTVCGQQSSSFCPVPQRRSGGITFLILCKTTA